MNNYEWIQMNLTLFKFAGLERNFQFGNLNEFFIDINEDRNVKWYQMEMTSMKIWNVSGELITRTKPKKFKQ